MSRARHAMKKASGGRADYYAGGDSNVAKEAAEKKHGGRATKTVEKMDGKKPKARMDKRPRKASGGRVGSDKSPFSSAARPGENTEAAKP